MEHHINLFLFEKLLLIFRTDVEKKSGMPFHSFSQNLYTRQQEGYKEAIYAAGGEALGFNTWTLEDVGTGSIAKRTLAAIELPQSNLLPWQGRWGKDAVPHKLIREASADQTKAHIVEACLYDIYRTEDDQRSFEKAVLVFGRKYSLLAYLFFLKDRSRYLPIATTAFDSIFPLFGIDFRTSSNCSWSNYTTFLSLVGELKEMLGESLGTEVSLLDAQSFAWMLAGQLQSEVVPAEITAYLNLGPSEREAIIQARIGQGQFRQSLITYWCACAVTGCTEVSMLDACHLKPWAKGTASDRYDLFNGLLLSPTLHRCLDNGYVTFSVSGKLLISPQLSADDQRALGLNPLMKLTKMDPRHAPFLDYHRVECFRG